LLETAGIGLAIDEEQGILRSESVDVADITSAFIDAITAHRYPIRDIDPRLI
jgi:hypothetical protein